MVKQNGLSRVSLIPPSQFTGETPVPRWLRGLAVPAMIQNLTDLCTLCPPNGPSCPLGIFERGAEKNNAENSPGREKKCSAGFQPAKVLLKRKELSRLTCRRDAGATIFSEIMRLR